MTTCHDCPHALIPQRTWAAMDTAARREATRNGGARMAARGLCQRCYMNRRNRGTVLELPRATLSREEVLAEWQWLADPSRALKYNIANIAPRLGMTEAALERALQRANAAA